MISGQEEIAAQKNSIEKLDLVLKELMAEKNPTALASILNRAGISGPALRRWIRMYMPES